MENLQEDALKSIAAIENAVSNVFSRNESPDNYVVNQTLKSLFWHLSSRSRAVSLLASCRYGWDAKIVLWSFYETAAKILYICFSPANERSILVGEYWNDFEEINDRRTAQKAEHPARLFEKLGMPSDAMNFLQDDTIFKINANKSKSARRRIEQKWSFVEIINQLSAPAKDGHPSRHITALLHIYGMASHLIHADKSALDLMHDRAMRDPDEREILVMSQLARIMSDQVYIARYCYEALRHAMSDENDVDQNVVDSMKIFDEIDKPIKEAFHESQKEFYKKWRESK